MAITSFIIAISFLSTPIIIKEVESEEDLDLVNRPEND